MIRYFFFALTFCSVCLFANNKAANRNFVLEDLKQEVLDFKQKIHALEVEKTILEERLNTQEKIIKEFKLQYANKSSSSNGENRIAYLEKIQESTLSDFQLIKKQWAELDNRITQLENHVDQNINQLKKIVETLVKTLQKENSIQIPIESKTYKVKSGDSLEKIAKNHNTSVQALKQRNQLKKDTIVIGQELIIE